MKQINDKWTSSTYAYDKGYADGYVKGYHDAWEKLKEKTVKPKEQEETKTWTVCGYCSNHLISKWKWCPYCGRGIDWNA